MILQSLQQCFAGTKKAEKSYDQSEEANKGNYTAAEGGRGEKTFAQEGCDAKQIPKCLRRQCEKSQVNRRRSSEECRERGNKGVVVLPPLQLETLLLLRTEN
jgi:hypothetical protein